MSKDSDYLALDDAALLAQCDLHTYRSSGPGGQHRNKVSSAVRLRHQATGITAHGDDSRSQHENKAMALLRLRMNFALQLRRPVDKVADPVPAILAECIFAPKGRARRSAKRPSPDRVEGPDKGLAFSREPSGEQGIQTARPMRPTKRLGIGRKDQRFWPVAAALLDILEAFEGRISDAAAWLGITTSNLVSTLQDDRHLLAAAQQIRKAHGHPPIK